MYVLSYQRSQSVLFQNYDRSIAGKSKCGLWERKERVVLYGAQNWPRSYFY